tara:strand:- start:997 stop:1623 length:627 start_codon:yes stop_codon:yes gene_type:complete
LGRNRNPITKKMKIIRKIFFVFFILNLFIASSHSKEPIEFIQEITNSASNILRENISVEQKAEKLVNLAEDTVDIKGIGLYSLGKHRKEINKESLERYNKIFKTYFLKSFSSRLSQYSDPKINVISENVLNDKYTIVSSVLIATNDRPEVKIEWRVYTKNPNNPLIRDLIIEGLSLARTQKEEFNSVIMGANGDVNALFANLVNFNSK